MSLQFATPPADGTLVVKQGIDNIFAAPIGGAAAHIESPASTLKTMDPYPVYDLELNDLAKGKSLDSANLTVWRYLLVQGNEIVQAAEIAQPSAIGGRSIFNALTKGYAKEMEDAFHKVDHLPELEQGNYEIRAIRVPSLYLFALWLKDLLGKNDRFVVVKPAFPPFDTSKIYKIDELFFLLQQQARIKKSQEDKLTF